MVAGTRRLYSGDFAWGRQTRVGKADLPPMVELVIQQIAAASISTNGQLGLLALWKRPHRARIGALPALGHLLSKCIPQYLLIRITYLGRLLARDLLFDRSIVRRETPVETGVAGDFAGYLHAKEA
jgi:hypothetical protein